MTLFLFGMQGLSHAQRRYVVADLTVGVAEHLGLVPGRHEGVLGLLGWLVTRFGNDNQLEWYRLSATGGTGCKLGWYR